jgi:hypothetical protein
MSDEIEGLYMDSAFTKILHFNGNHKSTSPQGTESNMINLDAIQRHFSELADYDGPTRQGRSPVEAKLGSGPCLPADSHAPLALASTYAVRC